MMRTQVSKEFKAQTTRAIIAIISFILLYIVVLAFALGLTALTVAGGLAIIILKPMFLTIALGIGLASIGFLVLIFLLKFMFKKHQVDRSHLTEITAIEEPALFKLIYDVASQVNTALPKKVYLSADVNAAVFYDSNFWSMFLPVKKNLQIGMGLVNAVTLEELRAILAHEFGHFSQRTMKVGSYVYNVNQVIFNILFDNEGYERMVTQWANMSGYFSPFVSIAIEINKSIQKLLRKHYEFINKTYMGLSREMEFQADEIAASVTGHLPLKNSLLRLGLAEMSFNSVVEFYNRNIEKNIATQNIYINHGAAMRLLAERNGFKMSNNLPSVSLEDELRFDKSKLVIKDQWASHPSNKERIERLEQLNLPATAETNEMAASVFTDAAETEKKLTAKLFSPVQYEGELKLFSPDEFKASYHQQWLDDCFPAVFNDYYDNKNPEPFELGVQHDLPAASIASLFSDEKVAEVVTANALKNDLATLRSIISGDLKIKTFDYDGMKYQKADAGPLQETLNTRLEALTATIRLNDIAIFNSFSQLERAQGSKPKLSNLYQEFFTFDREFDSKYQLYSELQAGVEFVNVTTPYEVIQRKLNELVETEEKIKHEIKTLEACMLLANDLSDEIKSSFRQYTAGSLSYFDGKVYNDANLQIMYGAVNNYAYALSRKYYLLKKQLLNYQAELATGSINCAA